MEFGFRELLRDDFSDVFYDTDELARPATYIPATGIPYAVNIVYNEAYFQSQPGQAQEGLSQQIRHVRIARRFLKADPDPSDQIRFDNKTYSIDHSETNGHAELKLYIQDT